ncbi:MAG: complex I NDUFA9 subunit family protein [Gammaproteobacteria bacterium]
MVRNICVLGGTGFVGGQLVTRLARDGHRVTVPSRHPHRHRGLSVLPTVRVVRADVHDESALAELFRGCDAVVNLVGILNEGRGETFRRAHVELPRKLAQAARTTGVRRLLHMSALGADAANAPSLYLRTKGEGEAALRVHAGDRIAYTVFQPSVIFGPGDSFTNRFASLLRVAPFFPLACPDARFQPVYVGDVAQAFVNALADHDAHGQRYTLCGPDVYTLRALVRFVARESRLERRIIGLPRWLGKLQAALLEFVPGKPFTRDNWRSLQADSVCRGGPGLAELGITPTSLALIAPTYLRSGAA